MKLKYTAVAILTAATLLTVGCAPQRADKNTFLLGTVCSATVYGDNARQAADAAFERVSEIEKAMSLTIEDSELNKVNNAPVGTETAVTSELFAMLSRCEELSELTDYRFDISLGKLSALWNVNSENPVVPRDSEISAALSGTGRGAFSLDAESGTVTRVNDVTLDLGGIAKGYAADEVKRVLCENGVTDAIVSLGGNIIALGSDKSRGSTPWLIGIANPRVSGELIATVEVSDKFVVTSGDYERFFVLDGVRYHHIIDPDTGRPAQSGIISATIIADNSALADAISTAAFVLGEEKALTLINSLDGVEAVLITDEMEIVQSNGMEKYNLKETKNAD